MYVEVKPSDDVVPVVVLFKKKQMERDGSFLSIFSVCHFALAQPSE